jgi:hypothetical protein
MVKPRKPKKRGRPSVADADRRDTLVRVLTTETEYEELRRAAAETSLTVSTWMRSVSLERARQIAAEKARRERHD